MQHDSLSGSPYPPTGTDLGLFEVDVSADADARYWRGAGIDPMVAGVAALFPPMAVNLTILLLQQRVTAPILHTRERLRCVGFGEAPQRLRVTGQVADRFVKRGRDYFVIESEIRTDDGDVLWHSTAELASPRRRLDRSVDSASHDAQSTKSRRDERLTGRTARMTLTAELLRTYSRAGNFHSDDDAARAMGLPGMTAMGMQTLGPAYGSVLDAWGTDFVARGVLEAAFFGVVLEDDTVETTVDSSDHGARFEVFNVTRNATTAAGRFELPSA